MRKKIILKLKPTVQKNNRHFVIFEFKYHAINMPDNVNIGMYHAYLLRVYGSCAKGKRKWGGEYESKKGKNKKF